MSRTHGSFRLGVAALVLSGLSGCQAIEPQYQARVRDELARQPLAPEEILTDADIAHLPPPVRKYVVYSGAVGKARPQNVWVEFAATMIKAPDAQPMAATGEQYDFFGDPARLFFMQASQYLVPFRVFHRYWEQQATMVVRVASLLNVVDISGPDLTSTETVTLLNDICVFAPGVLADKRLSWNPVDSVSAEVTFTNGPYRVSAILHFNDTGELVNFTSEDRGALQDDGTLKKYRWSTPLTDYREFDGRRVSARGEAIWHYPEGDFIYGTFILKGIRYNVKDQQD